MRSWGSSTNWKDATVNELDGKVVYVGVQSRDIFLLNTEYGNWEAASKFTKVLAALHVENPNTVFISPSVQNYAILNDMPDNTGANYEAWRVRCELLMPRCDVMLVLPFLGWQESLGVKAEIEMFNDMSKPVIVDRVARPEYLQAH